MELNDNIDIDSIKKLVNDFVVLSNERYLIIKMKNISDKNIIKDIIKKLKNNVAFRKSLRISYNINKGIIVIKKVGENGYAGNGVSRSL